jgi:acyl carrier protein
VSAKIGRLQAMEKDGASIGTAAADVADFDGLQRAVRQAEARFGPVHGVIHAAGVPGGGMLQRKVREEAEQILRPKVEGALNVVRLFEAAGIDFVVLMSSLTGVMGETGQIDYSAAGAFLDGLAHDRRGAGAPVCSIDWDTWREAGMAASVRLPGALQALRDESLRFGIGNDEGVEVLERVLASGLAQVVVSTREPRLRQQQEAIDAGRLASAVEVRDTRYPRPDLAVPFAPPASPPEQALCRIWEGLLGIDAIGVHDDFFELGGHSLLATQVLSRVRDQMSVRVSLAALFEHPTVASLAALVEARQLDAILAEVDRLSEDEVARQLSPGGESRA